MAIKYRRIATRSNEFGEDYSQYPHWCAGYEFMANRGPDDTIVEVGNGHIHLRASCIAIPNDSIESANGYPEDFNAWFDDNWPVRLWAGNRSQWDAMKSVAFHAYEKGQGKT